MFKIFTSKLNLCLFVVVAFLSSCTNNPDPTSDEVKVFDNKIALQWNQLYLEVEQKAASRYRPTQSARVLGYIGLATYEALVPGMPEYNSLATRYQGLAIPQITSEIYYYPAVYNAVYSTLLKKYFPSDPVKVIDASTLYKIYALETELNNKFKNTGIPADVLTRSEDYGRRVAEAVFAWSATDPEGHEAYNKVMDPTYQKSAAPGIWYADAPGAMGVNWGKVRRFATPDNDWATGPAPLTYSNDPKSKYYQQAKEAEIACNATKNGDYEGRWIAEFWGDDIAGWTFTPAARILAHLNQVVEQANPNLDKTVESYAKLGMALNDGAVVTWNLKYKWDVERPDQFINREIDKNWKPIMGDKFFGTLNTGATPPFPAYPSGHSTFGGLGAEVLTNLYGYNFKLTDRCHVARTDFIGTPRTFNNFYEMGRENAYSRIPLGVHFRMDCDEGLRVGYMVGRHVCNLPWKK